MKLAKRKAYSQAQRDKQESRIETWFNELVEATDTAKKSALIQNYLSTAAKFHNYSFANQLLIMVQYPGAARVAGYKKWQELNRQVSKGETAIKIFAPLIRKTDDGEDDEVYGFHIVNVFDISQTAGEDLPPAPDYNSTEIDNALEVSLKHWMKSRNIPIDYQEGHYAYGSTNGRKIVISNKTGTHTLLHEVAHVLLHFDETGKRPTEYKSKGKAKVESEAEATAHIVAKHFGLDDLDKSSNYIALIGSAKETRDSLALVTKIARAMISEIEGHLGN